MQNKAHVLGKYLKQTKEAIEVLDAALIVAAQKVEHYEIAGYGSVCTFARVLKYDDAARVLKQTMAEEETTDKKLSQIAGTLNVKANTAGPVSRT